MPFTQYNCSASIKNRAGWSRESDNFTITTLEDGNVDLSDSKTLNYIAFVYFSS